MQSKFNWIEFLQAEAYTDKYLDEAKKVAESYAPWISKEHRAVELDMLYTKFYRSVMVISNIAFVHGDFSAQQKKAMSVLTQIEQIEMLQMFNSN